MPPWIWVAVAAIILIVSLWIGGCSMSDDACAEEADYYQDQYDRNIDIIGGR